MVASNLNRVAGGDETGHFLEHFHISSNSILSTCDTLLI